MIKRRLSAAVAALATAISVLPTFSIAVSAEELQNETADFTYVTLAGGACITGYKGDKTDITIPSQIDGFAVTSIAAAAFYSRDDLESVTIPNSVTTIKENAFNGCKGLTSITIPDSVTQIRNSVFFNCTNLENIELSSNITGIGVSVFENTKYYNTEENWEDGVLYLNNCLIKSKENLSGNYTIKEGTKNYCGSGIL